MNKNNEKIAIKMKILINLRKKRKSLMIARKGYLILCMKNTA